MGTLRKLIELDTRFACWLAGRLGFWRIDVAIHLAHAVEHEKMAESMDAAGLAAPAAQMRALAHRRRALARERIPTRAAEKWRKAVA